MKDLQLLAERIYKANKTLATQVELIKLNECFDSPTTLALNAARLVLSGKANLTFKY